MLRWFVKTNNEVLSLPQPRDMVGALFMNAESGSITAGPSKFDLSNALFDKKGLEGQPRLAEFTVDLQGKKTYLVLVQSVQAEDGSGECWDITGSTCVQCAGDGAGFFPPRRVKIFFRTDRRVGQFTFVE